MIDLLLIAIIAVIAWCVSGEGAYHAGATLIAVIVSGLLAMNFFEPMANFLESSMAGGAWAYRWDMIALVGLFAVFVTIFRVASDQLVPTYVQVHPLLHQVASWGCGVLTGYVTMAFLLTALHTAPFPRDYWGFFYPEIERRAAPLSGLGPDYQWLGFTQYVTEKPFGRTIPIIKQDAGSEQIEYVTRMFDGRTGFLEDIPEKTDARERYEVLPSFPIRYASRRAQISGAVTAPPPPPPPAKKTGGGTGDISF